MFDYLIVFSFFGVFVIFTIYFSNLNSKIRKIDKRDQKANELTEKGFEISKRWDCNYISVFIDNTKKILFILVLDKNSSFFEVNIDDIINLKINSFGIIKGFLSSIYIDIFTTQNLTYTLRTLCITRGFGISKKSKASIYSEKCAKEIFDHINFLIAKK